jgi:hypothetical protein
MPFPTYPADLKKAPLDAVEKAHNFETDLGNTLKKLMADFDNLDPKAFEVPTKIATEKELSDFEKRLADQKTRIKAISRTITECNKGAFAKAQQLKKDKANPAAIKHVEKMVSAGSAFAKTMADLSDEADDLVDKARLLLEDSAYDDEEAETEGAPKADKFLLQGLKVLKSQPGVFALAIGGKGAYLVAGPRLAPDALKQAKAETGGSFLRGDCEWSQPKKAFVFVLPKKPPSGLAKKIRKAILDQTLKKLQVKVLVRGPDGQEIDAETDADTLGAVDLEDVTETAAAAPPPSQDSILFANRKRTLSPAYDKAIQANPASQKELDNLLAQAMTAAKANNWQAALDLLDRYEVAIKEALFAAPKPAKATAAGDKPAKPKRTSDGVYRQFQKLWELVRKTAHAELLAAEKKVIAYCRSVNDDPNADVTYDIADLEAKAKKLFTVLESLDERLIAKVDEVLTAMTEADRSAKHEEAKAIIGEYEQFVNGNDILAALQTSQVAQSNIGQTIKGVLNSMKSKL